MDSKSRVAKAVVHGGVFKWGDDPLNATRVIPPASDLEVHYEVYYE